ncbi:MAG: branched-chain amino acid ABC transporter permease [Acidimicrobiia bacterium]|nr:branched-chain amino acid ABC transporter permease [Acidimicrobiia bacterium]
MTALIPIFAQVAGPTEGHFAAALSEGLALGAIYALLAMGFVIIFKATQVLNFAHGALSALGAFLVASFATLINFPGRFLPESVPTWLTWTLSAVCALIAAALAGMILERIFIRPMVGEELFAVAIVTLGIDIALRNVTNDFIGTDPRPLGDPWGTQIADFGWITFAHTEIAQILVSVILVSLVAVFFQSKTGIAMRATAFDQEAARAQGINVGRIFSISWAIGAVLAAVAGIFISVFPRRSAGVDTFTAFFAFKALPAIILGGLDSVVGAIIGGFAIGLAEAFVGEYVTFAFLGAGFAGIVPYLVMLIVLIIRPYGLFGTEEIRRV